MIANLKKAARDRDTVVIAGGEFGRQELAEAARMLACHQQLLDALRELLPHVPGHLTNDLDGRPWIEQARTAILCATQGD